MLARLLCSSLLLALTLFAGVGTAAAAASKPPKAKTATTKKKLKAKKAKKVKKANKPKTAPRVLAPAATAVAPPPPVACDHTELLPDSANLHLIRAALVCLHNQVRAQHGLSALAENGALAAAGTAHAADMVQRGYFAHTTPEGVDFSDRILAARYAGHDDDWSVGENLAWGTAALSTPAALMRAWLGSEAHRHNILTPAYREVGFGLSLGAPTGTGTGITVSAEFGARV